MQILHQDEFYVAVNKPAGILVHRSRIDKQATLIALQMVRDMLGQRVYPVHRLDKPTSGVLLFALLPEAAATMMPLFESGQVEKLYLAVVRGYTDANGLIDYPLKEEQDKMTDAKANKNKSAQPALTRYRRLATVELPIAVGRYPSSRYSLLQVRPVTGRKHQIRRHMKHIFHPIVGDTTHGDGAHNAMFRQQFHCQRLLLHAACLSFPHPYLHKSISIQAPLDSEFEIIVRRFGWAEVTGRPGSIRYTIPEYT